MLLRNLFNLNRYCRYAQVQPKSNYGYWIAPDGTKHNVPDDCGHINALNDLGYDDYGCAFEDRWIRVVGPTAPSLYRTVAGLNLEIPPAGITPQQYSVLQQLIAETTRIARDSVSFAKLSFYIDLLRDSVTRNVKEHKGIDNPAEANAYLRSLISEVKEPEKTQQQQQQQPQVAFSGRIFDLNTRIIKAAN